MIGSLAIGSLARRASDRRSIFLNELRCSVGRFGSYPGDLIGKSPNLASNAPVLRKPANRVRDWRRWLPNLPTFSFNPLRRLDCKSEASRSLRPRQTGGFR
jgi:hypothetical protein